MSVGAKTSLLLFFFSLCASAMFVTTHVRARQSFAPAPHELFSVVNSQIAAFRDSDFTSAYSKAAAAVQEKFTQPQFELMIRERYPEMTRSHRVEFGFVKAEGASAVVQVLFVASDATVRGYLYTLTSEETGWKIEGVEPIRPKGPRQRIAGLHI